jgi:hypothetical protein
MPTIYLHVDWLHVSRAANQRAKSAQKLKALKSHAELLVVYK